MPPINKEDPEDKIEEKTEQDPPEEEAPEELTLEQAKARILEQDKKLKAANQEATSRRKKLEALELAEKARKEAELSETQKLEARAKTAEEEKDRLAQENKDLKLRTEFQSKARALKLFFVNDQAEKDAFAALDREEVGEDLSGLEKAIKALLSSRPYFFSKADTQSINDGSSKGKKNDASLTAEAITQKKKRSGVTPL